MKLALGSTNLSHLGPQTLHLSSLTSNPRLTRFITARRVDTMFVEQNYKRQEKRKEEKKKKRGKRKEKEKKGREERRKEGKLNLISHTYYLSKK